MNFKKTTEKPVKNNEDREEILRYSTEKMMKEYNPKIEFTIKTTEVISSKPSRSELITIEKENNLGKKVKGKKSNLPKKSKLKMERKTITKEEIYVAPKILLKKDGYELIITEKPQAALKISNALGVATKREIVRGVPYYEVDRNGKKIIVACAVGHLFTLKQNVSGSTVPIFDISWVPNYMVKKKDFTKNKNIKSYILQWFFYPIQCLFSRMFIIELLKEIFREIQAWQ